MFRLIDMLISAYTFWIWFQIIMILIAISSFIGFALWLGA
jgi:hypothetical protein